MPTPFMHLYMAERVQQDKALPEALRSLLRAEWPSFYFGSVAPDFQVISSIKREASHFYPIPPEKDDYGAFARMQAAYPQFADPAALPWPQAVLTAAYGAHLLYDLIWDHHILTPHFRQNEWGSPLVRFTAHTTLLAYKDRESLAELPETAEATLAAAEFEGWLPFDPENKLPEWHELLLAQLRPGGETRTVEIFASRVRMTPEAYAANLDDEAWMMANVFQHVPAAVVTEVIDLALARTIEMLAAYLRPLME